MIKPSDNTFLHELIPMDSPAVREEINTILKMLSADFNTGPVNAAFSLIVDLFNGDYPGYRACNTDYHDLHHTIDTSLTMARLIHGHNQTGPKTLNERQIIIGLLAALMHDSGYIQEKNDQTGTGAKYTATHVRRSMDFLNLVGGKLGLSKDEITTGQAMILCTDLAVPMVDVHFPDEASALLGRMLGAADILAQTADRLYLEKLLFLFYEFKEGMVGDYSDQVDLLRKTIGFYEIIDKRLNPIAEDMDRFMTAHMTSRWGITENLYARAIEKNKNYLIHILTRPGEDPRDSLRRNNIVERIREKHVKSKQDSIKQNQL